MRIVVLMLVACLSSTGRAELAPFDDNAPLADFRALRFEMILSSGVSGIPGLKAFRKGEFNYFSPWMLRNGVRYEQSYGSRDRIETQEGYCQIRLNIEADGLKSKQLTRIQLLRTFRESSAFESTLSARFYEEEVSGEIECGRADGSKPLTVSEINELLPDTVRIKAWTRVVPQGAAPLPQMVKCSVQSSSINYGNADGVEVSEPTFRIPLKKGELENEEEPGFVADKLVELVDGKYSLHLAIVVVSGNYQRLSLSPTLRKIERENSVVLHHVDNLLPIEWLRDVPFLLDGSLPEYHFRDATVDMVNPEALAILEQKDPRKYLSNMRFELLPIIADKALPERTLLYLRSRCRVVGPWWIAPNE